MQTSARDLEVGDLVVVMTKTVCRVVGVERHPDPTQLGGRRVHLAVDRAWAYYDTVDLGPGTPIERIHGATGDMTAYDTERNGARG